MTRIYAYNRKGLELLWDKVRSERGSDEKALKAIYKTYSKEQWEQKCKEFNFVTIVK